MGKKTGISWCNHTFNPWWGCEKISLGCQNCYAEKMAIRWGFNKLWSRENRRTFGQNHWDEPLEWNKEAKKQNVTLRVFCGSMCDIFELRRSADLDLYRARVFDLIRLTPNLEWLLLTKRPENINGMISMEWTTKPPSNVRIGITCENQEMADKRIPILLDSWGGKNFVSVEPMLSNINFWEFSRCEETFGPLYDHRGTYDFYQTLGFPKGSVKIVNGIEWIIAGCESGPNARPCNIDWVRGLRDECQDAGVPFFLKQMEVDGKLTKEPYLDGQQWLQFPEEVPHE